MRSRVGVQMTMDVELVQGARDPLIAGEFLILSPIDLIDTVISAGGQINSSR